MGTSSGVRRLWDGARSLPRGGVIAVTAGFLLHLSLGTMYAFGNLTTYLTSYLHVRVGLDVDYGDTQWVSTLQGLAEGPGVLIGGICWRRFGPRPTLLVGGLLCSGGMALCCLTVQSSLVTTMLAYGLMGGFGVGLSYTTPMLVGYQWFPRNHGTVSGIVVGGYGLGGIIFTSVQTAYLNPENVSPEDDGFFHDAALLDRVPSLFLVQAAICAGLQLCGVLGIRPPPPERLETLADVTETEEGTPAPTTADTADTDGIQTLGHDVKGPSTEDPRAWMRYLLTKQNLQLLLGFSMNAYGMTTVNSFWKAFGQTFIKDDHFLAKVGVGASVFNMLGRVAWGLLVDASSYKPTMVLLSGLLATLLFTIPVTSLSGQALFLIWVWAAFFCLSGTYSVVVAGTADTFGARDAGHIYGFMFLVASLGLPLVSFAVEAIYERWDYPAVYLFGGVIVCISLTSTFAFQPRKSDSAGVKGRDEEITEHSQRSQE